MSNKLQVGMKFDNMIKLCEFIGWKYDYKHSTRLSQKLRQHVEFHRENRNKIIIDKVIDPNIEMVQFKPKRNGYDYNVGDIVEVNNGQVEILEQTYIAVKNGTKRKAYKSRCLKCGYVYTDYDYNFYRKIGCGCCNGKVVVKGINDMWTTNPELAKLLANPDDGYKYTSTSGQKVDWRCPICNTIHRNKAINNIYLRGLSCLCSKSKSYPNRFMYWLLDYLHIEFEDEKTFDWSDGKRYDFYIQSISTIIEMHGKQHYEEAYSFTKTSLEFQVENDDYKRKLALDNGIKNYIEINSYQSDFDFIHNNIMLSKLTSLINLNNVDWEYLKEKCELNIIYEIANCWNSGIHNAKEIGKKVGLTKSPVSKYLNRCADYGLIESYDKTKTEKIRKENVQKVIYQNQTVPVKCNENNLYFGGINICVKEMMKLIGCKFNHRSILCVLNGKQSHHHHFTFSRITKEEFNEYKSEHPDKTYGDYFILDNNAKSA